MGSDVLIDRTTTVAGQPRGRQPKQAYRNPRGIPGSGPLPIPVAIGGEGVELIAITEGVHPAAIGGFQRFHHPQHLFPFVRLVLQLVLQ